MRKLFYVFYAFVLLNAMACSEETDHSAVVAGVAKAYYEYLLDGKYGQFVDGMDHSADMPASYRSQLIDNAKMFLAQMRQEHLGIDSVRVRRAALDSTACAASVFLMFHYGDSTVEQVIVPMVKRDSVWYMR